MNKIVHLTSAHPRYDTRIFLKMCISLSHIEKYEVILIVADGKGDETKSNVKIIDVGAKTGGRISRMTKTVSKVYKKAIELDADLYHLHDPELIPTGLKLKKLGKKVIFDAHEDLPKQLLGKPYLNKPMKIILSNFFTVFEKLSCNKFDFIITATPSIRDKFLKININSIDINNYPILGELESVEENVLKKNEVCYVGGIADIRGIKEVIKSLKYVPNVSLNLVGKFNSIQTRNEVQSYEGWSQVNELGFKNRQEVANILASSIAGLVTFHPLQNHIDAQPNKMFEYMSAGLPIITSNFPLWREIVEGNNCGVCVDPLNPKEIADAIQFIVDNPLKAKEMGENGKNAIYDHYNWSNESKKLFELYDKLIGQ